MKRIFTTGRFLTTAFGKTAFLLTLFLTLLPTEDLKAATDDDMAYAPVPTVAGQPTDSPLEALDKSHRLGMLVDYVQNEAPGWAPGLREALRAPLNWTRNGLQSARDSLGMNSEGGADDGGLFAPIFQPVAALMQPPATGEGQAAWLTPGYHHKGFLPFHDAMIMSFNLRQRMLDDRVQLDMRPFYGQNWVSSNGYGGGEIGINLSQRSAAQPWGRVAVRYIEGDQDLMDQGHGIDMHAELRFDDHLSLHAGVRENEETQLGNYVMLRWRLADFGP